MAWFTFVVLSLFFIFSSYEKGLYFHKDFYGFQIIIFTLFITLFIRFLLHKGMEKLTLISVAAFLPVVYLISTFYAASPQGAWDSFLRWVTYIAFFFLLYWSVEKRKIQRLLPIVFVVAGGWIALYMLLENFGFVNFHQAVVQGRFSGFFQYPNTFGMMMAAFFVFSLSMLMHSDIKRGAIIFYSSPLVLFFLSFFASYSRTMYIIFPVIWLMGLFLFKGINQIKYIVVSVVTCLISLIVYSVIQIGDPSANNDYLGLLVVIIASALATLIIYLFHQYSKNKLELFIDSIPSNKKKYSQYIIVVVTFVVAILGVLDIANKGLVFQALPDGIQERIVSIGESTTSRERFIFYEDALNVSKDSPVFGHGGEAWSTIYRGYQQLPYQSNKIHNEYLEWLLDIGWLGLIVKCGIFLYLYFLIAHGCLKSENKTIPIAVLLSSSVIFSHSFFDFNLSYGTVWFFVFWLITMGIRSIEFDYTFTILTKIRTYLLTLFLILVLVAGVFSFRFMTAENHYQQATDSSGLAEIMRHSEKAVNFNPYNVNYLFNLADNYSQMIQHESGYLAKTEEVLQNLVNVEPKNSNVISRVGIRYDRLGLNEQAFNHYYDAIEFDKYDDQSYTRAIINAVYLANSEVMSDSWYTKSIEVYDRYQSTVREFEENPIGSDHNSREFSFNSEVYEYVGEAYFKMGNVSDLKELLANIQAEDSLKEEEAKITALIMLYYEVNGEGEENGEPVESGETYILGNIESEDTDFQNQVLDELSNYRNKFE
ncbi:MULTISPECIES: O-antigen ligase family protein [Bacillaceae]|uniref:O-antigen ligase family protein n=1 Tax=Evansella alkalicola TaxID=745819 RepID=A0ABS6JYP6_9BACI|nr:MULTISPECIES: O-antigen ligase family protein [Bacillaceae]MBU9723520.1 O-antigen ligase family protein [Bacillus alkalicola]